MKKVSFIIMLTLLAVSFIQCTTVTSEDDPEPLVFEDVNPQNMIAFVAAYDSSNSGGSKREDLVIMDYYNHDLYKIIEADSFFAYEPKFSPDKSRVLFGDFPERRLYIHNIFSGTYNRLIRSDGLHECGSNAFWRSNGAGIFLFTIEGIQRGNTIRYFDLSSSTSEIFKQILNPESGNRLRPVLSMSPDTLMVYTNDTVETGLPQGYFLIDKDCNYCRRIENNHLTGSTLYYGIDYDIDSGLLVFSEPSPETGGYKIAVSNLDGSFYEVYTEGNYDDLRPVWGPGGNSVLFERHKTIDFPKRNHKIMMLDISSGNVTQFIDPIALGYAGVGYPDY